LALEGIDCKLVKAGLAGTNKKQNRNFLFEPGSMQAPSKYSSN
jgi:hypothetical protein